jgi:hypothetical protein
LPPLVWCARAYTLIVRRAGEIGYGGLLVDRQWSKQLVTADGDTPLLWVLRDRMVTLHRVHCVVDCGVAFNPDAVVAQMGNTI